LRTISAIVQKLPKANSHPLGENPPNPLTLVGLHFWRFFKNASGQPDSSFVRGFEQNLSTRIRTKSFDTDSNKIFRHGFEQNLSNIRDRAAQNDRK
jgi:hypothetical protein